MANTTAGVCTRQVVTKPSAVPESSIRLMHLCWTLIGLVLLRCLFLLFRLPLNSPPLLLLFSWIGSTIEYTAPDPSSFFGIARGPAIARHTHLIFSLSRPSDSPSPTALPSLPADFAPNGKMTPALEPASLVSSPACSPRSPRQFRRIVRRSFLARTSS
jgi:hypothetical protein